MWHRHDMLDLIMRLNWRVFSFNSDRSSWICILYCFHSSVVAAVEATTEILPGNHRWLDAVSLVVVYEQEALLLQKGAMHPVEVLVWIRHRVQVCVWIWPGLGLHARWRCKIARHSWQIAGTGWPSKTCVHLGEQVWYIYMGHTAWRSRNAWYPFCWWLAYCRPRSQLWGTLTDYSNDDGTCSGQGISVAATAARVSSSVGHFYPANRQSCLVVPWCIRVWCSCRVRRTAWGGLETARSSRCETVKVP